MRSAWMLVLLLATVSAGETRSREEAIALLRCTDMFTSAFVGPNMAVSGQVEAFNVILQQPDAMEIFSMLQRGASPEGQLFGLCGLYLVDRPTFGARVVKYRTQHGVVQTICGCIVSEERVPAVVAQIESGAYPSAFKAVSEPGRR